MRLNPLPSVPTMRALEFRDGLSGLGLSFTQFAELMGVSLKTVSLWANNRSPVPRPVALYLDLRLKMLDIAEQLAGKRV